MTKQAEREREPGHNESTVLCFLSRSMLLEGNNTRPTFLVMRGGAIENFSKEVQHDKASDLNCFLGWVSHRVATLWQYHKCSTDLCNTGMGKLRTGGHTRPVTLFNLELEEIILIVSK